MVVKRTSPPSAPAADIFSSLGLGYLGQFLGLRINELVLAEAKRKGFAELRESHGYVIQHLVETDRPVSRTGTELARRMGVTQQAASKSIADLVRLGAVAVTQAPTDRRAKLISLSASGWDAVRQTRRTRARLENKLRNRLGPDRYADARQTLRDCLNLLGGISRINSRRIRQPG